MSNINFAKELLSSYQLLKKENPKIRARNAAEELNVSEGELLACQVDGNKTIRLTNNAEEILKEIESFGEVIALTRNEACVHERKGIYLNAEFSKHGPMSMGLFANPDIDLRLFMNHWKYAFANIEDLKVGSRKSIQFFAKDGSAIHKIYLTNNSNEKAFDELVKKFKNDKQEIFIEIEKYEAKKPDLNDDQINWQEFRKGWENLKDTHDFFPLLRKFKVGRQQSFRKIGQDFAYLVANDSARKCLDLVRDKNCEMMVFVGNKGCIQIHTGPVKKLVQHENWYNVLDPKFNLHLDESKIAETWVTKKPTEDGIVTALEIFDNEGEIIATFFGKRKPEIPELELWREIINKIPVN